MIDGIFFAGYYQDFSKKKVTAKEFTSFSKI